MVETDTRLLQYRLPASTHIGRVRLAVSNLSRSRAFYRDVIGLMVHDTADHMVYLGAEGSKRTLIELEELPGIHPIHGQSRLGLYHIAILLPSRESLASFTRHLVKLGIRFGSADHLVSEALYLVDPDGLQVEVYADRPRETWMYKGGELVMAADPLRFRELPQVEDDSWRGTPSGTTIGHVHLYVGDLEVAKAFYCTALGLDVVMSSIPGALFTSAGGYHHHVGLNTWAASSPPASAGDARLLYWELVVPNSEEMGKVTASLSNAGFSTLIDPWGIKLALVSQS
jgi:catechol 2,3-dioxygenase